MGPARRGRVKPVGTPFAIVEPMRREPLAGRDREQALIVTAFDAALSGSGSVVMISGPAGIGKSALAEALAEQVEARKLAVVRGRAWEFADAPPYFPIVPALRSLGVDVQADTNPFALWERVLGAMASTAASRPLVWLLEDLHAADLLTLDLLVFLAQPVRSLPVLIVVTTRHADARIDERVAQRLGRLSREGVDLRLGPLSPEHVATIAERWHGRPLPSAEKARLVERAEGNPLFVVEMAQAPRFDASVPPTIRQLVLDRVSRLPEAARRALGAGAVVGREFGAGIVAQMLGVMPARIVDDLAPALHAGLVAESRPGGFVFGHVLERDAIEDGLSATERARLHAAAASALALAGDSPSILLERARHALSGGTPEDEARTLALVDGVLVELEERGALDRALSLHARLDEARRAGLVLRAASPEERLRRAALAHRAGHYAECRSACDDVIAAARKSGDARLLARAALTAFGELRPGIVDPEAVSALEEAGAALGKGDEKLSCRVEARLTAALQPAKDPYAVTRRAQAAIARARATGDEALVAEVLVTAGSALVDYIPPVERRELARELRDYAERRGDLEKLLRARARLAMDSLEIGDFVDFSTEVDAMLELSLELGHPRHRWLPLLFASMRACMHGRFSESERYLVEVDQLAVLTDDPALPMSLAAHRGVRAKDTDDLKSLAGVESDIAQALQGVPEAGTIAAVLRAGLFARARDRARTEAELTRIERALPFLLADETFICLGAEPAALAGSPALQRILRERIEAISHPEITSGHVPVTYEGPRVRLLALLDAALGDTARAEAHFRDALARAKRYGLRPWVARIDAELGSLLAKRGAKDEAHALLAESAALAAELGMPSLLRDVAPPSVRPPVEAELGLARDGDVWRVMGGGRDVRVRDMRGMRLLARLVEHPGQEIHVLVLASDEGTSVTESDAGARIDESALRALSCASRRARGGARRGRTRRRSRPSRTPPRRAGSPRGRGPRRRRARRKGAKDGVGDRARASERSAPPEGRPLADRRSGCRPRAAVRRRRAHRNVLLFSAVSRRYCCALCWCSMAMERG
jgi:hypothetical protein